MVSWDDICFPITDLVWISMSTESAVRSFLETYRTRKFHFINKSLEVSLTSQLSSPTSVSLDRTGSKQIRLWMYRMKQIFLLYVRTPTTPASSQPPCMHAYVHAFEQEDFHIWVALFIEALNTDHSFKASIISCGLSFARRKFEVQRR